MKTFLMMPMLLAIVATFSGCTTQGDDEYVIFQDVPSPRVAMREQTMPNHINLVLASDQIFKVRSAVFSRNGIHHLDQVIDRIQARYEGMPHITIDAYYSEAGDGLQSLTQQQASNVAAYLWSHGLKKNHIRYRGHGSNNAVSSNDIPSGTADNRRIEINIYA